MNDNDKQLTEDPAGHHGSDTIGGSAGKDDRGEASSYGSFRSSSGDDDDSSLSVRSDHAQDYYEEDNRNHYGGRSREQAIIDDDDDDEDNISGASSIQSLQSCEIIAAYSHTTNTTTAQAESSPNHQAGGNESYYDDEGQHSYYSIGGEDDDDGSDYEDDSIMNDDDSLSLGFPPGHITRLDEWNELQNHNHNCSAVTNDSEHGTKSTFSSSVNPSIIPSYFFCPITTKIMIDPVITPDGHTFERRAILRSLILAPEDPISNTPLLHEELVEDYLVKQSIDKARKEAWIRYVVEFKDDSASSDDVIDEEKRLGIEGKLLVTTSNTNDSLPYEPIKQSKSSDQEHDGPPSTPPQSHVQQEELPVDAQHESTNQYDDITNNLSQDLNSIPSPSTATVDSSSSSSNCNNHGWSVPLGVHRISCTRPGLVVTSDVHRRSNIVKRKIIKKSIVDDNNNIIINSTKKNSKKMKIKRKKKKKHKSHSHIKTTTSVITRDLMLPPGSHVEILETRVHGGRVRGRIVWEEEVATEMDHELSLLLEEEEVRKRAMARPTSSPGRERSSSSPKKGKSRMFFRKKSSTSHNMNNNNGDEDKKLPFTSELFDRPPHHAPVGNRLSQSPSPLTTIKYNGWISLQWVGSGSNFERDEAIKQRRRTAVIVKDDLNKRSLLVADEDEGPWSQPLPLGVYRISGNASTTANGDNSQDTAGSSVKQLPLYDAPDSESNIVDFLVCNQCLEIVETQVLMMKRKDRDNNLISAKNNTASEGKQVVRARCMVPVIVSPLMSPQNYIGGNDEFGSLSQPQRKFRSGWITLINSEGGRNSGVGAGVMASPIPLGAYIVTTTDPLLSCDANANIKSILPSGSCMEVVTTRIEFEENTKMMKCRCGREGMYYSVAVRALIASGGYVTLFVASVGTSGTHGSLCVCGQLIQHVVYAEPVPLGVYRIIRPTLLTRDIGHKTHVITQLMENAHVQVAETRVEEGCVRGRVNVDVAIENNDHAGGAIANDLVRKEPVTGWVSLFEPPLFRWAEQQGRNAW